MMFGQTPVKTAPTPQVDLVAWYAGVTNTMITKVGRYPDTNIPILTLGVAGGIRKAFDAATVPARDIADSIGGTWPQSQKSAEKRFNDAYAAFIAPSAAKVLKAVTAKGGSPIEMAALANDLAAKEVILPVAFAEEFWKAAGRYAIHLKVYLDRPVESKYARAWGAFRDAVIEMPGVVAYYIERTIAYVAEVLAFVAAAAAAGLIKGAAKGFWRGFGPALIVTGGLIVTGLIIYKATRPRVNELPAHEGV
jgi:hypothetical protein